MSGIGHPELRRELDKRQMDFVVCLAYCPAGIRQETNSNMPNKLQGLRAAPTPSPWPHSGLETEEINIFCDIKIPRSYHITDVDLTQIGTEILTRSNSDSGTEHHRAGRNIICWCHLFCRKQYYSQAPQLGLKCQGNKHCEASSW